MGEASGCKAAGQGYQDLESSLMEVRPDEHMARNIDHSCGSAALRRGRMGIQTEEIVPARGPTEQRVSNETEV